MQVKIDNKLYEVEIIKKISNRNTYIRVKEDLTIYVTTNKLTSDRYIVKLLNDNIESIKKMITKINKKNDKKDGFYYLGHKYDIIYTNSDKVILGDTKVFLPHNVDISKWYYKEAMEVFKKRLDYWYSKYTRNIPYPSLTIRKMKTRWGVCNTKLKRVTLNLELIKKDIECLDYVIVHELSHFIEGNHSKRFWSVVEENYPNYKMVRKQMKEE